MTKDLALLINAVDGKNSGREQEWQTTDEFLDILSENLAKSVAAK